MADIDKLLTDTDQEMKKVLQAWQNFVSQIRTGRASNSLLDPVMVNYYGTLTPLNQLAQILIPEPHLILIKPYDRSQISEFVGGINRANLGLTPIADAEKIRLSIPPMTEDIRKDTVRRLWRDVESFKVRVRNQRRSSLDRVKNHGEISEDMLKNFEKEVQELTNKYVKLLDQHTSQKEKEIMTI